MNEVKEQIERLRHELNEHNYNYYVLSAPVISDREFDRMMELGEEFLKLKPDRPQLFYIWGHSYEFDNDGNWDLIESFCSQMKDIASIWYATNIEIYDYVQACRRLVFGIDGKLVSNPSAIPVWIKNNWEPVRIEPGATVELK